MAEEFAMDALKGRVGASTQASVVDLGPKTSTWDDFVSRSNPGSYLQTSAWAQVKARNGWTPMRFIGSSFVEAVVSGGADRSEGIADDSGEISVSAGDEPRETTEETAFGAQILIRKPRLFPWAFAYAPRGPVFERWNPATLDAFTVALRDALASGPARISHVRIEPEIEMNGPWDVEGEFRHALRRDGWRVGTPIQPLRTRQVDLKADETALWGDLRKKWRQYVNKARKSEVRVVDSTSDRLPEFYSIYRETAKRAGFVTRTYESYLGVWEAFARLGMARLLMAEGPDGVGLATLFLLRVGDRVIEPYGGMTEAGAESRANYLLKWEAIRTSREQGAKSYDMWGLSHEGIEHFKTGFGGREIRYVGAWDLVLDPAGRLAFDSAQVVQDRIAAWRHGIRNVRRGRLVPPAEVGE
jgi:lipid II:glycine glycyltransferase (peptidoglycan interpeptide bridge formation enzyme)